MANKFTRFNRTQIFSISRDVFVQDKWLSAEDIFNQDVETFGEPQSHLLVGAWKHEFPVESRIPGAPAYKYTLGVKLGEEYYYVNCPSFMNKDFDEICASKDLIREINNGHCLVVPYEYESRGETRYAFEFTDIK